MGGTEGIWGHGGAERMIRDEEGAMGGHRGGDGGKWGTEGMWGHGGSGEDDKG